MYFTECQFGPRCAPPSPPLAINTAPLVNIGTTNQLRPVIDPILNMGNFNQPRYHQRAVITRQPYIYSQCEPEYFIQHYSC